MEETQHVQMEAFQNVLRVEVNVSVQMETYLLVLMDQLLKNQEEHSVMIEVNLPARMATNLHVLMEQP